MNTHTHRQVGESRRFLRKCSATVKLPSGQEEAGVALDFLLKPDGPTGKAAGAPTAGGSGGGGGGDGGGGGVGGMDDEPCDWRVPGATAFLRKFTVKGTERRVKVEVGVAVSLVSSSVCPEANRVVESSVRHLIVAPRIEQCSHVLGTVIVHWRPPTPPPAPSLLLFCTDNCCGTQSDGAELL